MKEIFIDDDNVSVQPAVTIESMVTENNLTIVAVLNQKAVEANGLFLGRTLEEGGS